jgi:hypothetical protein
MPFSVQVELQRGRQCDRQIRLSWPCTPEVGQFIKILPARAWLIAAEPHVETPALTGEPHAVDTS